jgi:tRNA pseudouridine38-40 synthase
MRFAVKLSFNGSSFYGWQSQQGGNTVQDIIENTIEQRYGQYIPITGCCRTDSGVHASDFVFHFDSENDIRDDFIYRLNKMLPETIALKSIQLATDSFHSRFDAVSRSYTYNIHSKKNAFANDLSYYFTAIDKADFGLMQHACEIIKQAREYYPFCKSKSDVNTMTCNIMEIGWNINADGSSYSFRIVSDRFLRGMVRMIVGACLNIGLKKIEIDDLAYSLKNQARLNKSWSVPAHGLFLDGVKYRDNASL